MTLYEVRTFTLHGGPWHGYTAGYDDDLPLVLEWDTPKGVYRYVKQLTQSGSSSGPFYEWRIIYEWAPPATSEHGS